MKYDHFFYDDKRSSLVSNVLSFQEVFTFLLRSFHSAHSLIVQEEGTLTTLTACVVLPIRDASSKEGKMDRSDLLHYGAVYGRGNRIDPNYLETGEYLQGILLDILWYFPINPST